ncbi:MAG: V-type ATP synthase subunit I [Candidatus Nanohaloarchaea archaeon]
MVRPAEMTKISVTGPKSELQAVIEELHGLSLMDIEEYDGELETGEPFEEAEELSETLVDVRSLISKLPGSEEKAETSLDEVQRNIDRIREEVEELEDRGQEVENELSSLEDQEGFFRKIEGSGVRAEDLKGSETLDVYVGRFDPAELESGTGASYEVFEGRQANIVFYREADSEDIETALREIGAEQVNPVDTGFEGEPVEVLEKIEERKEELGQEKQQIEEELQDIADEWRSRLENAEEFLTEKVEKSEAPIKFATTKRTFIAEGWVPAEELGPLRSRLEAETNGKIHIQEEEGENPPVKHDNPGPVKPFESLTDLVSTPRYNELDPSFMIFLTFPVMFGFMIGDAGYGITTLAVFYAGYRMFPEAKQIFKSLMYASVATIVFGLAFGDAFGYMLFGSHSDLAHVTGIHLFEQIPVLFHRAEHLGQVFNIAALFGLVHVNAGYLLGGYNEYVNHGLKEAFLEKGSWLLLEVGAALWYFVGMTAGLPVILISIVTLYLGEGVEGVVEIPSLISNVLSYLRIFGVSVAAVALAGVVNSMAQPLFEMHTLLGTVAGIGVLMIGHTFNTFIKIMEGFLQGIRLHYVELFTKFFEGGGRKYAPFGARK